jgi:hypothetical protein
LVPSDATETIIRLSIPCLRDNDSLSDLHATPTHGSVVLPEDILNSLVEILRERNRAFPTLGGGGVTFPGNSSVRRTVESTEAVNFVMKQTWLCHRSLLAQGGEPAAAAVRSVLPQRLGNVAAEPCAYYVMSGFLKSAERLGRVERLPAKRGVEGREQRHQRKEVLRGFYEHKCVIPVWCTRARSR